MGLIVYGKVTKIHGLAGELRVLPYSRQPESLELIDHIFISRTEDNNPVKFEITKCRVRKDFAILKLKDIDTPEDAEKLKDRTVYVEQKNLPATDEDEYYWFQLIGLEVYTEEGQYVGKVENLMDRSLQSLLVVTNNGKEVLIPFSEPIVKKVDLKESKLLITPIVGLLDQE